MECFDTIVAYLKRTYHPETILVYGSYADGSAGENSDFDALVIADGVKKHDASVVAGVALDVFIYPSEMFRGEYDPSGFVQVIDGTVVLDQSGAGRVLQERVQKYIESLPQKSAEEIADELTWCEKMLARTLRGDAEGAYRAHWLLVESAEIYCDVKGIRYPGPKKTLRMMEQNDPEAFRFYAAALQDFCFDSIKAWIDHLKSREGSDESAKI